MKIFLLLATLIGLAQAPAAPPLQAPAAPPPATDIYLVPLTGGLASMKTAKPVPVSNAAGYDNQPSFSADGSRILYAGNRNGKQIDIYAFDRATGKSTQLTQTPENENSPTMVPEGAGPTGSFTVVQSEFDKSGARPASPIQRLWRFNADGKSPQLILADINPVGYHAWIDPEHLLLFVLGQPATLQIANVKTGKSEIVADAPGRSLHRIPGTRSASWVRRDPAGDYWIMQLDPGSKGSVAMFKAVDGSSDRDNAWMPDGRTILMTSGTKVFSATRGEKAWTEVFDGAAHQLGVITRLSVSPKGDAVAIVVAETKK